MSQLEANKQVVRAYVEAFNRGDFDALRQIYATDAVVQGVLGQGGMEKVIGLWRELRAGLARSWSSRK
jgi:ketosteroid isomerase-like protein